MAKQTFTTGQVLTAAQMTSLQQTAMGGGSTTAKTTSYVLLAADAGTTVAMNAAGATTITVNTGLFAAGDSVFIQNWGAGTTTVTAGTATVTTHGSLALSQWEGGQLYFTSSSAAIFFDISQSTGMTNPMTTTGDTIYSSSGSTPARLGIGTTGQVLTVASGIPSWATPASGGGMTLLETLTFSGSSVTSSSISGSYKNLQVIVRAFKPATDNTDLNFRFNSDSNTRYKQSVTMGQSMQTFNSTSLISNNNADNSTAPNLSVINIYDYADTSHWKFAFTNNITADGEVSAANLNCYNFWQVYNQTSAITTITFYPSSGNFTSGSALIYGVN